MSNLYKTHTFSLNYKKCDHKYNMWIKNYLNELNEHSYNINMFLYISLYSISFRWSPECTDSQNHSPHLHVARWCPWDLFKSIKICLDAKESGVRKATGSYRTYSVPGRTAVLVFEFAVEDLPSAELQPRFRRLEWRTCSWAEHYWWYFILI